MINRFQTALLLFSSLSFALAAEPEPSPASVPADPAMTSGTLSNGLSWAVLPNQEPPGKVSLRLVVKAGSLQESEPQRGLAHFLEHMAFNGSKHYPPGELVEYLQRIGMSFGADTNAHTSFHETVYKLELPDSSDEFLREGLRVLADYADGLLLEEDEIERERGVILAEMRSRDTVGYRSFVANWQFLLQGTTIPERMPIGIVETVSEMNRPLFVDFYDTWYRPERCAVVAVGDVTADTLAPLIQEFFGSMQGRAPERTEPNLGELSNPGTVAKLHFDPEAPDTNLDVATVTPVTDTADSRERRIRDLQIRLVNAVVTDRLQRAAREPNAPFRSASAYSWRFLDHFEMTGLSIDTEPGKWRESLRYAEQSLRQALEHGFDAAEIAEACAKAIEGARSAVAQAPTRLSANLANKLADACSEDYVFTHPDFDLEVTIEATKSLTPSIATSLFREIWSDPDRFLFVSGNLELEEPEAELLNAWEESRREPVEPYEVGQLAEWAYPAAATPAKVVEERFDPELKVYQATLENNVRFNALQTDFERETVHITVRFGSGRRELKPAQMGAAMLADFAFLQGGLVAHSFDDVQRLMAGKSVKTGFSVGDDAFSLTGKTTPEHLLTQAELMAAYVAQPGFRGDALGQAQKQLRTFYAQLHNTPEGTLQSDVMRFLSGDHRTGPAPEDIAMSATMESIKAMLSEHLKNGWIEVSVVGDIEPHVALDAVARTFGHLPHRIGNPAEPFAIGARFPSSAKSATFQCKSDIPKAIALAYWPTGDMRDITVSRQLNLLAQIFDDRLRLRIREELGEGYSPYASSRASDQWRDFGYLFSLNIVAPENAPRISAMMAEIGMDLASGNITEDEFKRAREPMLNFLKDYRRRNSYWLQRVVAGSQAFPEQLEWARTMESDYVSFTLHQLNSLAQQILATDPLRVHVVPDITANNLESAQADDPSTPAEPSPPS